MLNVLTCVFPFIPQHSPISIQLLYVSIELNMPLPAFHRRGVKRKLQFKMVT